MGETSGYIRFEEPEAAQKARAAAVLNEEGGLVIKNYIAVLEPVSGKAQPANNCLVWTSFLIALYSRHTYYWWLIFVQIMW